MFLLVQLFAVCYGVFRFFEKEDKEQKGRYVGNWKGNKKAQKGKEQQNNNGLKGFTYMDAQNYHFSLLGEMVKAYPKELANDIKYIESSLRVISSGIAAATVKGRDFIPHADLALCVCYSIFINQAIAKEFADEGTIEFKVPFTVVELTLEQALAFLSKDQLTFENQPNGYLLLTYKGVPLGFVKNLGNRSNNLWPQARRIRMAH